MTDAPGASELHAARTAAADAAAMAERGAMEGVHYRIRPA